MIPDWVGILGLSLTAILGASSLVSSVRIARGARPGSTRRDEGSEIPKGLEDLSGWLNILRQLDIPDFEVTSVLKTRREQGVFRIRFPNAPETRVLKVFAHEAGAATMLTAQREIFATFLLGDGPTCLHPVVARTRDRSATALIRDEIPGETLLDFLVRRRQLLNLTEADVLVRRLCTAADELHHVGMIHCDIKPSNIIGQWEDVLGARRSAMVRLIDFGMFAPVDPQVSERGPVAVEGTPNFTAPERLFFSTASRASDVYSCAMVTTFALTGQHQSGLEYVPRPLRAVLRRASSRQPAARYSTMGQFADAWNEAFSVVTTSRDPNRTVGGIPWRDSLIESAGRDTITRSPLSHSSANAAAEMDQRLIEFRERYADIIGRLDSIMESTVKEQDSVRVDALLEALEVKLASSALGSSEPPETPS